MDGWWQQARCRDLTPQESDRLFFLDKGGNPQPGKTFCKSCPVKSECFKEALMYEEKGIWGGSTSNERNRKELIFAKHMFINEAKQAGTYHPHQMFPVTLPLAMLIPQQEQQEEFLTNPSDPLAS